MNEYQLLQADLESDIKQYGPTSTIAKHRQRELHHVNLTVKQFTTGNTVDPLALAVVINHIHNLVAELEDRIDALERHS
jgi:hypothetical protein